MHAYEPVSPPLIRRDIPEGAKPWDARANGIQLRATGVPTPPIYTYQGSGENHLMIVGPGTRAFAVDVSGHEADPWYVVQVIAYGFYDLAYRETMRHQRTHVWKSTRTR